MITGSIPIVNMPVGGTFTVNDYYLIAAHEYGTYEWNVLIEQAYMRLSNDVQLCLSAPLGVPDYWWDEKAREWFLPERSGESVDSETLFGYNKQEVKNDSDSSEVRVSQYS